MNLSNSKLIIGAFQTISKVLDGVSGIMEHIELQIPLFGMLALMAANSLGHKIREHEVAKEQHRIELERKVIEEERNILKRQNALEEEKALALSNAQKDLDKQRAAEADAAALLKAMRKDEEAAAIAYNGALEQEMAEEALENEIEMQIQEAITAAQKAKQIAMENEILAAKLQQKATTGKLSEEEQKQLADAKKISTEARKQQQSLQKDIKDGKKSLKQQKQKTAEAKKNTKLKEKELNVAKKNTKEAEANLKKEQDQTKEAELKLAQTIKENELKDAALENDKKRLALLKEQTGETGLLASATANVMAVLTAIPGVMTTIATIQKIINFLKDKERIATLKATLATKKQMLAEKIKAAWAMAGSASAIPYAGWIIAGAILAAILGMAIAGAIGGVNAAKLEFGGADKRREEAANEIKALGAEIYKLEESANNIDTLADSFENLGKKVIKSKEDVKAMEEDLAKLGETMEEEAPDDGKNASEYDQEMAEITGGKSEKEYYEDLTDEGKIEFARKKAELQRKEADRKRDEQLQVMNDLKGG